MSAVAKVARRGFLLASAAVTGGVAFGVWAVRNPHANPLAAQAEDGEAVFNPWVTVTAQGITLIAPHADKGQGVFSTQAALIAEEMDLAWGDPLEQVASYFFASAPGHPLWRDILDELIARPPHTETYREVVNATGPGLLTRVFTANRHRYEGVVLEPRLVFSPYRIRGSRERATLLNNGQTVGIQHASGSWKERWTPTYFKAKLAKRRTE